MFIIIHGSICPTKEAVRRLIDEERVKAAGLLTEEAAGHLVASNLGLNGVGERLEAKLRIGDLTSGLSDVSFTGRVIHVFPARTLHFLSRFGILRSRVKSESRKKQGGWNDYVRSPFLIVNAK